MQAIQNQNIQSFNQMLYAQQQALGQAAQSGFKNLAGTGATIAEAIEGKKAIDDKTIKDPVTTGQMGVTDSGIQTPTPEGFGLDAMQQQGADAIGTGMTKQQGLDYLNSPNFGSMQFGQQTTSGLDQVYPMQSFYDPSASNAFNALSPDSSAMIQFGTTPEFDTSTLYTDLSGF